MPYTISTFYHEFNAFTGMEFTTHPLRNKFKNAVSAPFVVVSKDLMFVYTKEEHSERYCETSEGH